MFGGEPGRWWKHADLERFGWRRSAMGIIERQKLQENLLNGSVFSAADCRHDGQRGVR